MRQLVIGSKVAKLPIIQGGMGVGVSLSRLAGAVAHEGGVGIISTAQIGFDDPEFEQHPEDCNLRAIERHIKKAKELAGGCGLVGVNVMVALRQFHEQVRAAVKGGADVIISGAGLPTELPEIVQQTAKEEHLTPEQIPAIAPIVSSEKAAKVILKHWARKYNRTADFLVIEGPKAGGHLGFSKEELSDVEHLDYDREIENIIACKRVYEEQFDCRIPVIVAGGIYSREDVEHALSLGADGVQAASRFVATEECDASDAYKQAYVQAKPEEVRIVQSPVGMPGRALNNAFIRAVEQGRTSVKKCYGCIKSCNPGTAPYCITKALIEAVRGNLDEGLIFCGANVGRIDRVVSVHELMQELSGTV